LMDGTSSAGEVGAVLATAVGLTLVFAPLTSHLYRRRG
ncbi:MAG: ABC transporter permease, partial [Thermoleophilia bacterium]|nr:ABC transporter permease [Thermoleophilia bacterium]